MIGDLRGIPGIDAVVSEQAIDWHYASGPIAVDSFDSAYVTSGKLGEWPLVGRHLPDLSQGFAQGRIALISTSFELHLGVHVGDTISLDTPTGPLVLRVGGVVSSLLSPRGAVIVAREVYKRRWGDSRIVHALIRISGTDTDAVRSAIARRLGKKHNLAIFTWGGWRSGSRLRCNERLRGCTFSRP